MNQLILLLFSLLSQSGFASSSETKKFDIKDLKEILVENQMGHVTVSSSNDTKASVIVTKNKFSDKCQITLNKLEGKLVLKVEKKSTFSFGDCDVDFDVKAPKDVDLNLSVGSGNLKVQGINGALVSNIGNGDISAEGLFGKINVKSGNGKISIKGMTKGGELKTGNGEIELKFAGKPHTGELYLVTGHGDATILVPKGSELKTSLSTGIGKISNQLGDSPKALFVISMKAGIGNLNVQSY